MNAKCSALAILLAAFSCAVFADTTWVTQPDISGNWIADHSPYMIQTDVHVPSGNTLAVGPGVTVYFTGHYSMTVDSNAWLSALGTATDSVLFTSDITGFTDRWKGIRVTYAADTVRLEYCVLENAHSFNSGSNGALGQALNSSYSNFQLRHCVIRFCEAESDGGGIQMLQGSLDARSCTFTANQGINGGAAMTIETHLNFTDCLFENNAATGGGGALDLMNNFADTIRFENCIIRNNSGGMISGLGGGGVCCELSTAHFNDCTISGNSCGTGGGVKSFGGETLIMTDCLIADNVATFAGGGIGELGAESVLERCVLDHNSAASGGAISTSYNVNATPTIRNCAIVRNSANEHGSAIGNGASSAYGTPRLLNTIIAFNTESEAYAFPPSGSLNLHNNVFFGNSTGNFYQNSQGGRCHNTQVNVNGDSCDADLNLILNPLFADTATGNFHLTSASPCIDAGWVNSPNDPDGTIADIGAFYFDQTPETAERPLIPYPSSLSLASFPNPFNAVTTITFDLPAASEVSLKVFDITGREVATLVNGHMNAGSHVTEWNAAAMPSGTYFAVLTSRNHRLVQKLMLLK